MIKHQCSECGSRNWPSLHTSCPLCYGEPDSEDENLDVSFDEEEYKKD
jgi:hypothetical protein